MDLPNASLCATLTLSALADTPGICPSRGREKLVEESNKVLIVDDRADIRVFLSEFMRIEGFSPLEASGAEEAIQSARRERPALILMDIMMPGRDGLSAVQEIRAEDDKVGIIVMTAFSTEQRAVRAMQVGADDYIRKPFDMQELQVKTRAVLQKNWLRVENSSLYERLEAILSRYMPTPVADRLIRAPELPRLGGDRQEVTLLFADLRGFSSFAVQAMPEDLLRILNHYLSVATEAILSENGTVDKFLGDGIMAIFNAPLRDPEHVLHAVRAAMAIQRNVADIEPPRGISEPLRFGAGIHTGEAVVGNIGAAQLMSFTAVGDAVNIAKRLEENARPGQVIVSESVVQLLGDQLVTKALEPVFLKGVKDPMPMFEVVSLCDSA
jgi:class 3 adenylate cyclase